MQFINIFFNLFTCAGNYGPQVTDTFGVNPPCASAYLDSANNKLLIPS